MAGERRLKAVLLDVDGTLVDSNAAHARAWKETLAAHGHDVPLERIRPLIGMGGDKMLPELTGIDPEGHEGKRILDERTRTFLARHARDVRAFPEVRGLVLRIRERGLLPVVASSAGEEELSVLVGIAGIADLLHESTSSSDAGRSKPDPDIVQAALAEAGAAPGEAVLVGDTRFDVEAGARSGVPVIALRCGGAAERDLSGAVAVYADPADLLASFDASPIGA